MFPLDKTVFRIYSLDFWRYTYYILRGNTALLLVFTIKNKNKVHLNCCLHINTNNNNNKTTKITV